MKNVSKTTHLFFPDIAYYINGRDEVCKIILTACQKQVKDKGISVSLSTKFFAELNFTVAEMIAILSDAGKILMVKFSYSLLLQQSDSFTVEDLGSQLWKYMAGTVKYN